MLIHFRHGDIAIFRKLHRDLFARFKSGDEKDYLRLNREIHRHLFAVAGNESLTALYEQLLVRIHAVRFVARKTPTQWQKAVDEHRGLMEAIEERDGSRLATLLRQHLLGQRIPLRFPYDSATVLRSLREWHVPRDRGRGEPSGQATSLDAARPARVAPVGDRGAAGGR